MYSYEAVVRYSETGGKLKADAAAIANYLQDCAILHSEKVGIGIEYLKEHNYTFKKIDETTPLKQFSPGVCKKN